jgi:chromosome segregation ATPase
MSPEQEKRQAELLQQEKRQAELLQQAEELRSQLHVNTQQLLELQQELVSATTERDKLSLCLADSAKVRAEQQVQISQLSTQNRNLQRELESEIAAANEARHEAATLAAEKQEVEIAFQIYREHHGTGDDHKLSALKNLQLNAAELAKEVERKQMKLGEQQGKAKAMQSEVNTLQDRLANSERQRIKTHNAVQELQGNIRVFCRIRPAPEERELALQVRLRNCVNLRHDQQMHSFQFDQVFGPESSQADVFCRGGWYGAISA